MAKTVPISIRDLRTYFFTRRGIVKAVDGVSFDLAAGETLGIVGESGSGKSVLALSILRLVPSPPGKIVSGQVMLNGQDLLPLSESEMQKIRGKKIALILQDPLTSLNPVLSIGDQLTETIRTHGVSSRKGAVARAVSVLKNVRIPSAESRMRQYPHQMSGGMRQRVVGAIALSSEPDILIADEPTTSLDVTLQAQYLKLLREIQREAGVSIILITHDFGIVAKACDRVAVMYAGRIVEAGDTRDIFNRPSHPYTEALLKSVPKLDEEVDRLYAIPGHPPAPHAPRQGCPFSPRCPYAMAICETEYPSEVNIEEGHIAACWNLSPP